MIRLFLAIILALDAALFTAVLYLFFWKLRQIAVRTQAIKLALGLPQGVVIATQREGVIAMNKEAKRLFPSSETTSSRIERLLPMFDAEGKQLSVADHPIRRALHMRHSVSQIKRWVRDADGQRVPITVSVAYVPTNRQEQVAVLLARDISQEELMETMKRDFIGIASHQLRSPLASLKWYGEILTRDARESLGAKQREYLDRMNDATERMISLIDDFLDAAKFEDDAWLAHVDKVSLKELLSHIVEVQEPVIQSKKLSVRISRHGDDKPVYADPAMLREVLANFVANAVKYNRKGGKVFVRISVDGDWVEIEVRDTGVGIPKDQQDRLFTKFFRADNAVTQGYKGTGLGLYTAKLILEQMKGTVRFVSEQGKGTTFWVRFPRDQRKQFNEE